MPEYINILSNKKHQTMRSFGASGAWWAQVVGAWDDIDPESGMEKRERISQLLFDPVEGIGITCFRYNIGAGSMHSGAGTFSEETRRTESFDAGEGKYDWSRDKAAVWILKSAVKNGADEIIFFVNSPIERLTKNNKSHLDKKGHTNLAKENYKPFADYCLDVTEHFINEGIPVKYLSPVNEPVWVWSGGQEGCHYRWWQVRDVMKVFARELEKRENLRGKLKLSGAENGDLRWFNKTYARVMLNDPVIRRNIDSVDTHSYFLNHVNLPFIGGRTDFIKRYKKWMDKRYPGVELVTSEWCHMQGKRHYGMDSALVQAKIMYEDISLMDAPSWQLWIACSDVDYCDGLIYLFNESRTFRLTKRYYAFGNFSKFIKKGDVRVEAECADKDLKILAFENDNEKKIIIINDSFDTKNVSFSVEGEAEMHITDNFLNLECTKVDLSAVNIYPESVNTLIIKK